MDSALRPRDIQARIRAGESADQVAEAAGVPVERIAAFAAPVLAERDHVAGLARTHPVRRRGETTSHRTLRNAIADALAQRGVDPDEGEWDAWKLEDRRWRVQFVQDAGDGPRVAEFLYDQMGRFSVATNEAGALLIGDGPADDLALVQAALTAPDETDAVEQGSSSEVSDALIADEEPVALLPNVEADDAEDAFRDGDLAEVDGVYDIVAPATGDLDVLYDMLSSFDEDSVKIYAGLVHPKESGVSADAEGPHSLQDAGADEVVEIREEHTVEIRRSVPAREPEGQPEAVVEQPQPGEVVGATPEQLAEARPRPAEPEQLSLIDDVPEPPRPAKPSRRKRASVPSWDEIMFGSPQQRSDD